MISMSYRACFLYFASDIAAKKAAKSPTYTDAVANAATSLKGALKDLTGITPGAPVFFYIGQTSQWWIFD